LHDALKTVYRSSVVLPAYICPSLSAMASVAGKRLTHVEVDRRTLLPDPSQLESLLASRDTSDTVLLIDHAFGYPFGGIAKLREIFPDLLIIEDCARALGVTIGGDFPGRHADWVLLSMYKTIRGSRNGAVLLTRAPLAIRKERLPAPPSFKERFSTVGPIRWIYHGMLAKRMRFETRPLGDRPEWETQRGLPGELCASRFAAELKELETRVRLRAEVASELTAALWRIDGVRCIQSAENCTLAGNFVSFAIEKNGTRDALITKLYRQGLFVTRTWDIVPGHYPKLEATFPSGPGASLELADRMAHIPVDFFQKERDRRRLIAALQKIV